MKTNDSNAVFDNPQVKEVEHIKTSRFGRITRFDEKSGTIWVDYQGNPFNRHLIAELSNPLVTIEHLKAAIQRDAKVQIDFMHHDPAKPIVREIFFTPEHAVSNDQPASLEDKQLIIEADRILLSGKSEVVIQCGNARTVYSAKDGSLIEEADRVQSSARVTHKIRGGTVDVN